MAYQWTQCRLRRHVDRRATGAGASVLADHHEPAAAPSPRVLAACPAGLVIGWGIALLSTVTFVVDVIASDELDLIIQQLANNERNASVLTLTQSEEITDYENPQANVRRSIIAYRDNDRYRIEIDYPELSGPPARTEGDDAVTFAYLPALNAKDDVGTSNLLPEAGHGIVATERTTSYFADAFPVTNIRPLWPYNNETLSDFILREVEKPGASVSVETSASGREIVIDIVYANRRRKITLDRDRSYSLISLEMYYDDAPTDIRTFDGYEHRDGVWLATAVSVQMHESRDQSVGRRHQFRVEEWDAPSSLDSALFRIVFPEGTLVRDFNTNMVYRVAVERGIEESMASLSADGTDLIVVPEGYEAVRYRRTSDAANGVDTGMSEVVSSAEGGGNRHVTGIVLVCIGVGLIFGTVAYVRVRLKAA